MKLFYLYLSIFFSLVNIGKNIAQSYTLTTATNGTSNLVLNCKGRIVAESNSTGALYTYTYTEGQDRWETYTNGGVGPMRINIYRLDMDAGDSLRIYQGLGISGPLLGTYTGRSTFGSAATSTTGIITVRFTSNTGGSNYGVGFTAIIGCPPVGCNGNSPAGDDCSSATRICAIKPYCGNTGGWYTADHENIDGNNSNIFTGVSIDNNSWLVFTANATYPSFNVDVSDCADPNTGIQMQIYSTNCTAFTAVSPVISQDTPPNVIYYIR